MAKNDPRNLNVTIKNETEDSDSVIISFSSILRYLKKYFLAWLMIFVILFVCIVGLTTVKVIRRNPPLTALISFNYNGVEKGVDPAGKTFDVNSVKNPQIIASALAENDIDLEKLEDVRQNISFEGIIPSNIMDKITTYKSVYENAQSGNLAAAQAMLDVTYYPTQFKVYFNYSAAGFGKSDAVQLLNTLLDNYREYFYEQYGYNKSLGTSVTSIDYLDYDYPEALDLFSSNLTTLSKYVKSISSTDVNNFRSVQTGLTFNDITQSINTIKTIDLEKISSYVNVNNVTKDKESAIAYYQYRIDSLTRTKENLTERLNDISETIDSYQKDQLLVMTGADGTNTQLTQGSAEYDKLVERKDSISSDLAETKQNIKYYTQRKEGLEKATPHADEMAAKTDEDLARLHTKLQKLVEDTRITSEEYYETVEFANAYSVLVPAVNSSRNVVKSIVKNSLVPSVLAFGGLFIVYIAIAFIAALKAENSKKPVPVEEVPADDDDDDENDADTNEEEETPEEEENSEEKKKTKKVKNKW